MENGAFFVPWFDKDGYIEGINGKKLPSIKIIDNIYKYVEENPDIQILKVTVCDESKIIFDEY